MNTLGAIRHHGAYALGKMLNHSSWQKGETRLPRRVTPSDIDVVFDNYGKIIFCEFSREHDQWASINRGQRILYENIIKGTPHCAVICKHNIRADDNRIIDSRHDVSSFEIMICEREILFLGPKRAPAWEKFVFNWYANPMRQRRAIISEARKSA